MDRRAFLAVTGAVAGCTSRPLSGTPTDTPPLDTDGDGVPDKEDDYPNDTVRTRRLVETSETFSLDLGDYRAFPFDYDGEEPIGFSYDLLVTQGKRVDVLLMTREGFQMYKDGQTPPLYTAPTVTETEGDSGSTFLRPGEYVLVVDNTGRLGTPTADGVRVQLEYEVATSPAVDVTSPTPTA